MGLGPAGIGCLGCRGSHKGQRRAGVGWAGGGSGLQGHRTVLIQLHRSDGMKAINYCDKMQSWPLHCRRGGSIPVPRPTPGPMPRPRPGHLCPPLFPFPHRTHSWSTRRVCSPREETGTERDPRRAGQPLSVLGHSAPILTMTWKEATAMTPISQMQKPSPGKGRSPGPGPT